MQINNSTNDIFISYRRENGSDAARLIKSSLKGYGHKIFLDVDDLNVGHFDEKLLGIIESSPNFLIVLSRNSLDRVVLPDDWIRKEVTHALHTNRNIIPISWDGFQLPKNVELPSEIKELLRHNIISYSHEYFSNMIERINKSLVKSSGLSYKEKFILDFIRGKADIKLSASTLFMGMESLSDNPFFSMNELTKCIDSLVRQNYFSFDRNGNMILRDRGKVFYRQTKPNNEGCDILQIDEHEVLDPQAILKDLNLE